MKNLKQIVNLKGKQERITMMDFRKQPGEIITQVSLGKEFIISRAGKKIALLRRYK